nr:hypothetical protein [Rhizobium leguminosarum]
MMECRRERLAATHRQGGLEARKGDFGYHVAAGIAGTDRADATAVDVADIAIVAGMYLLAGEVAGVQAALAALMTADLGPNDEKYSKRIEGLRVIGWAWHKERPHGAALKAFIQTARGV